VTTMAGRTVTQVIDDMALAARDAGLRMARSTPAERTAALHGIAAAIERASEEIVAANLVDLGHATRAGWPTPCGNDWSPVRPVGPTLPPGVAE